MSTGFTGAGDSAGSLGSFDSLSAFGADLYTALSPDSGNQAPILRLELFSAAAGNKYGQLIFDTAWSPGHFGTFNYNQWNTVDIFNNASSMWLRGSSDLNTLYDPGAGTNHERTFADWKSILSGQGYQVISVNAGIGSFNGTFQGGMDNLQIGFGGNNKTFNFEAVPEPTSMCALGLGALAMIRKRRAKK